MRIGRKKTAVSIGLENSNNTFAPVLDILFIPPGENESLPRTGGGFKIVSIFHQPSSTSTRTPTLTNTATENMFFIVTE